MKPSIMSSVRGLAEGAQHLAKAQSLVDPTNAAAEFIAPVLKLVEDIHPAEGCSSSSGSGPPSDGDDDRAARLGCLRAKDRLVVILLVGRSNLGNSHIATLLGISINNVKVRIKRIFATLKVDGRFDLFAKFHDLIPGAAPCQVRCRTCPERGRPKG